MKKLTRVIYASRVAAAVASDLHSTVREVLRVSRVNNARVGVTGMLLTHAGHFVQALEGEEEAVEQTLARVALDPRHDKVKVLGRDFVGHRSFGRWAMCANKLSAADDDILKVLEGRGEFDPYSLSAPNALRLLKTIADIHGRQAQAA